MGLSITLSGIINKTEDEVTTALKSYLKANSGGLEASDIDNDHRNFCVIEESERNTTIFFPPYFLKWDECCIFLSERLNAPVFSLNIYDGDFWSYTLFYNGEMKDQFMPIPDYFDSDLSQEEINTWQGNAQILADYVPGLKKENVEKYLVCWDTEQEEMKAYEDDEFTYCEWQLTDFMRKLKLAYPINDTGMHVYKFWSIDIPLIEKPSAIDIVGTKSKSNAWWKFW